MNLPKHTHEAPPPPSLDDTAPQRAVRPSAAPPGKGLSAALLLLATGAVAWGVILVLLLAGEDAPASETPSPTVGMVAQQPTIGSTLGAEEIPPTVSVVPIPTATLIAAPGATLPPAETVTPTATASTSPGETPVSDAAADDPVPDTDTAGAELPPPPAATAGEPGPGDGAASDESAAGLILSPTVCAPPAQWEAYTVQPDDTWFAFVLGAQESNAEAPFTVEDLMAANCLDRRWLKLDETIFLPPGAAENAPPSVAVAPSGSTVSGATGPRTPNCPCTISIRQGWRREQIADAIDAAQTMFTGADFLAVTGPGAAASFDFVMERPAGHSMEGYLYPGTYVAENETTAEGFRDMLLAQFGVNVSAQMRADAAAQGVSFYEALIIASVVQRESYTPEIQPLMASIFYNRLRDGNRLASTVPISYALGVPGNWWPGITGSNMNVESPYNTYTQPGLPPAPIDNPDINAIRAAIYPADTNYYYHSRTCDGQAGFFETYEQHLANLNCE